MEKRNYSVIVFDLGNVLIPFNYDTAIQKLNNIESGLGDHFFAEYNDNYHMHRNFERGDVTVDDFILKMLEIVDNKIDRDTFCHYYSKIFTENEEVAALLPVLKQKYKLVLLSNTNSIHQEYGWKDYSFLNHFDKLILSHEVGAVKPEEAIYKAVEEFTGNPPEEHIFIDDIADYVQGAKNRGWDGIQFINHKQLITDLEKRGIL